MDWTAFLEEMSDRLRLTPEQRGVFLARLAEENFGASEANIAAKLNMSAASVKKHMTEIYDRTSSEFPSLSEVKSRGKLQELRFCLKEAWKQAISSLAQPLQAAVCENLSDSKDVEVQAPPSIPESPLKPSALLPGIRRPNDFVGRVEALKTVKNMLLSEGEQPSVVAITGLGGLGKTYLAEALVSDPEVQSRFSDGILWVTLGQEPALQTLLGQCIRQLDKSRDSFSATTEEFASQYLQNLLLDRQILLVLNDVWNAADTKWFRVGGPDCRILVTTRIFIPGAEQCNLGVMTSEEAVELIRKALGKQWNPSMEEPAREFAKLLGYLPLAMKLMAVQVARGRKWEMLKKAFLKEAERLRSLDQPGVKLEALSEDDQRNYSLRACFGLSLQWLEPKMLERFIWLGVLREDATLQLKMTETLWNVEDWEAEETSLSLYESSLLTAGPETLEGEPTYQVHDLLHAIAQELIEYPRKIEPLQNIGSQLQNLPGLGLSLPEAHRQFLERYRAIVPNHQWDKLPNDGYIYRYLTWHMEQANWNDEVHVLMAMSDERGRNAWFEACDRIGQPAIFVEDVARGWRLAEQEYQYNPTRGIVLQCRYALITATLNSLLDNLPIGMMAEFVKRGFWKVEQAWAYVEQMQSENDVAEAIQALASYLSDALLQIALGKARTIKDETRRAQALSQLAKLKVIYFSEALEAVRAVKDEIKRTAGLRELAKIGTTNFPAFLEVTQTIRHEARQASVLSELAKLDITYFPKALEAVRSIQDVSERTEALCELVKIDEAYLPEALESAQAIQSEEFRAKALCEIAKLDAVNFPVLLESARAIQDKSIKASILGKLAKLSAACLPEALEVARVIQDDFKRAYALIELATLDTTYFPEALEAVQTVQDQRISQLLILTNLAKIDAVYFPAALEAARATQDETWQAFVLSNLAKFNVADFSTLLQSTQTIQDEYRQSVVLSDLAKLDTADFFALLKATKEIQKKFLRVSVLSELAKMDTANFSALLDAARAIQDDYNQVAVLSSLSKFDSAYFSEALEATETIQDEFGRTDILINLAKLDAVYFSKALESAQTIQDEACRAPVLSKLAKLDTTDFSILLEAVCAIQSESWQAIVLSELAEISGVDLSALSRTAWAIQDEYHRAFVLINLAKLDRVYFSEALKTTRAIQDEYSRASMLSELAKLDMVFLDEALEAAQAIQNDYNRTLVLSNLAKFNMAYIPEALEAARAIQDEYSRASMLSELAKLDVAVFPEAVEAAQVVQDESLRAKLFRDLTKLNPSYFAEALEAARAIQYEPEQAEALRDLAKLDAANFFVLLESTQSIEDEYNRVFVLRDLAEQAPKDFLPNVWNEIFALTHKPTCAIAFSGSLSRLPLATLPYDQWQFSLHTLAYRKRSDLMQDLVTLYPAILHLGGEDAMRGVVDAMREVCSQWK